MARSAHEFEKLEAKLKRAREEAARAGKELVVEKVSREKAERSIDTFLGEAKRLEARVSTWDEELKIAHAQVSTAEIACIKAERDRNTVLDEM